MPNTYRFNALQGAAFGAFIVAVLAPAIWTWRVAIWAGILALTLAVLASNEIKSLGRRQHG